VVSPIAEYPGARDFMGANQNVDIHGRPIGLMGDESLPSKSTGFHLSRVLFCICIIFQIKE